MSQSKEEYESQLSSWIDGSIPNHIIDRSYESYKDTFKNPNATKEDFKTFILKVLDEDFIN